MPLSIQYTLRGAGWSRCRVELDDKAVDITASYLSDALGNLVLAAGMAYSGFHAVSFGFDEEPGEFRWVIERLNGTDMSLRIVEFGELWGNAPTGQGTEILAGTLSVQEFALEVKRAASTVLAKHGVEGYREQWVEHPFPTHQLAYLNELLARYAGDA